MKLAYFGLLLLPIAAFGCSKSANSTATAINLDPSVKVVHAEPRNLKRDIGQPGVIDAYERTSLYTKVAGFVGVWNVDIGDRVKKGAVMVELVAPDLVERHNQMKAQAVLDRTLVDQSRKLVDVADSNLNASIEMVLQSKADVKRYQADVEYWTKEVTRLTALAKERVVDKQVLDETKRQLKSSQAQLDAAEVAVSTRDAQRLAADATLGKSRVDVTTAEAKVKVSDAEERRLAALVAYLTITAPYDGIVYARNVNTGDFVMPASGDPSEGTNSLGVAPSRATPMYVFIRQDPMLFVVGVPEAYHRYVTTKTTAQVRVPSVTAAYRETTGTVTRSSFALNSTSRTLMVEIDIANPTGVYRPGMYAYGTVHLERDQVRAVPVSAITKVGLDDVCYLVIDGKAVQTRVEVGLSDGEWIEVSTRLVKGSGSTPDSWKEFDGTEAIIAGDLSQLSDGITVTVQPAK